MCQSLYSVSHCAAPQLKEPMAYQFERVVAEATSSTMLAFCALSYDNVMRPGLWRLHALASWWLCPRFQLWLLFSTCMTGTVHGVANKSDLQQTSQMWQWSCTYRQGKPWLVAEAERRFYMCEAHAARLNQPLFLTLKLGCKPSLNDGTLIVNMFHELGSFSKIKWRTGRGRHAL